MTSGPEDSFSLISPHSNPPRNRQQSPQGSPHHAYSTIDLTRFYKNIYATSHFISKRSTSINFINYRSSASPSHIFLVWIFPKNTSSHFKIQHSTASFLLNDKLHNSTQFMDGREVVVSTYDESFRMSRFRVFRSGIRSTFFFFFFFFMLYVPI